MQEEGTKAILKHNPIVSSFMTCHWVGNKSNATGVNRGVRTIYATGTLKLLLVFVLAIVQFSVFLQIFVCAFSIGHIIMCSSSIYGFLNTPLVSSTVLAPFFLIGSEVLHPIFSIFIKLASGISQKEEPPVGIEQNLHIFHSRKIISGYS